MKRLLIHSAIVAMLFGATSSFAIPFSTTIDYSGTNGKQLTFGNNSDSFYSAVFSQTVNFAPLLDSFNSASLNVTYSDIATTGELYAAYLSNIGGPPAPANLLDYVSIGALPGHDDAGQHTNTFELTDFLPTVPADGLDSWTLYIAFRETTPGNDKMILWNLTTYGEYNEFVSTATPGDPPTSTPTSTPTPTPEPSTVALMGLGLAGLGIAGWRRKKN